MIERISYDTTPLPELHTALRELELLAEGEPTVRLSVVTANTAPIITPAGVSPQRMPIDEDGYEYLESHESWSVYWSAASSLWDDTTCQLGWMIRQYNKMSCGRHPSQILLNDARYDARPFIQAQNNTMPLIRKLSYFYPIADKNIKIPYVRQLDANFEIMIRGTI